MSKKRFTYTKPTVKVKKIKMNFFLQERGSLEEMTQLLAFRASPPYPPHNCISGHSLIDTPAGKLPISTLHSGMEVWTVSAKGQKTRKIISKIAKVPMHSPYFMVNLVFADGRKLIASPTHPTTDSRTMGDLKAGDQLNGVAIFSARLVLYQEKYAYDLLPEGETGWYWANGVLIGSMLFEAQSEARYFIQNR